MTYEFLDHTADLKIEAKGPTLDEAFVSSALALKEAISRDVAVRPRLERKISVAGHDNEALLYAFLEELLFLLDADGFLLAEVVRIRIDDGKLSAELRGDSAQQYDFCNDVKAVTYSEMAVFEDKDGWTCRFVLDV